jgi:hypothetical protein
VIHFTGLRSEKELLFGGKGEKEKEDCILSGVFLRQSGHVSPFFFG